MKSQGPNWMCFTLENYLKWSSTLLHSHVGILKYSTWIVCFCFVLFFSPPTGSQDIHLLVRWSRRTNVPRRTLAGFKPALLLPYQKRFCSTDWTFWKQIITKPSNYASDCLNYSVQWLVLVWFKIHTTWSQCDHGSLGCAGLTLTVIRFLSQIILCC